MASIPLKREYGPTLGTLLAPSWRSASRPVRAIVAAAAIALLALLLALVLALLDASYSHGGSLPFSFKYKGLFRTTPDPGGYVKVRRPLAGPLQDSYAVAPLRLARYSGHLSGALPLYAASYIQQLRQRFDGFRLEGEGKTRISSTLGGYDVLYTAVLAGQRVWGRDVMLLPERSGAREGVVIEMLSTQPASIAKPVASSGALEAPLKTFSFG